VDRAERTSLHYAALEDDADLVAGLIAGGADVNAVDKQGFTPLHFACQQGALTAARFLLDAGAEVDSVNAFGDTPLYMAVGAGSGRLVKLLRELGADPLIVNKAGGTPAGLARILVNSDTAQYFEDVPDAPEDPAAPKPLGPEAARQAAGAPRADGTPEDGWWGEYQRLWNDLVPSRGQAPTVQGELVRCIGRLTDEAYRNGNQNWTRGSGHRRMLAYIERTLLRDATFDEQRQAAIRKDIAEISDFKHPNTGGNGTCYYDLTEAVVDWCRQHEAPIPRETDPGLRM
jgi:hypothetical protein